MSSSLQRTRSLRKPSTTTAQSTSNDPTAQLSRADNASPSRLPQFHSRSRSTATSTTNNTTSVPRARVASGGVSNAASAARSGVSRAAQEPVKRDAASRYPPSTTVTRTNSTATRPTSSGSGAVPAVKRVAGHARAKSTTTSSATTRPPSRELGTRGPGPASREQSTKVSATARTAAAAAAHSRTQSVDRPSVSQNVSTPTKPAATSNPRLRPAFSTLQQHYSPAKSLAPKPLTASYLAPPSPSKLPANVAASAETQKLQAELLQLHLLHKDAEMVDLAWRESAKTKLRARTERLEVAEKEIGEREKKLVGGESVIILQDWRGRGLESKIQVLDAVINGAWTMSEPGGRHARVVRRFERWMDQVSEMEESRRVGTALHGSPDGALFVSELEAPWREESMGLMRKLSGWQHDLRELGDLPSEGNEEDQEATSLVRTVRGIRSLIDAMLTELAIMGEIEEEVLEREAAWIERVNREDDEDDTPRAGAIWRTV